MDLFKREQVVYDDAMACLQSVEGHDVIEVSHYAILLKEYKKLLKQSRNAIKIADRTMHDLITSKLDLLSKVHFDELTLIYNRRYLDETLKRNILSLSRTGGSLSVLMMDIDSFKKFNDNYGHTQGDHCLKSVASALNSCLKRADDFLARYGGEEFFAVLPNTEADGAKTMADRMLERVKSLNVKHEFSSTGVGYVTVSIGITSGSVNYMQNPLMYINRADEALYESKNSGKNKYTYFALKEDGLA
ncbi:MAG: GGDEF domain-containing protein [Clostridiales bacterium]|jgi:diguanylate cyclase (GGDEF)-like protein|nr:GGDEF domain-containing protein [Clostridiales bacterium]